MAAPWARVGRGAMTLTKDQTTVPAALRKVLDRLAAAGVMRDFYLAGGTGLALLLGHRRSVDLDCFSRTNRLRFEGRRDLLARLRRLPGWVVSEEHDGTVHGRVGRVRVSFFWYPQPLVRPFIRHGAVRIASMADIGLMKVGAIIGRGSRKDFIDLYVICQHLPLPRLLALGKHKFRGAHDFTLQAVKALSFFEDAERDPPVVTPRPIAWRQVTSFFLREVQTITRRSLARRL